ncbi:MAG: right-handed parallel beta-helix repeat-containing protein, partial [Rikenellaceae bacterium]
MNLIKMMGSVALVLAVVSAQCTNPKGYSSEFNQENNSISYKTQHKFERTIYVDAQSGSDKNSGLSADNAIKSLDKLAKMSLKADDQVLLKGGQSHHGSIELFGIPFNEGEQLHIGSYGEGKATLDFSGYAAGFYIKGSSNIVISDLKITANGSPKKGVSMLRESDAKRRDRIGVYIEGEWYDQKSLGTQERIMRNITITNVDFYDIFYYNADAKDIPTNRPCRSWSEPSINYGLAVEGRSVSHGNDIENVLIEKCTIKNTSAHGMRITGSGSSGFNNLTIREVNLYETGGPGYMMANCKNVLFERNKTLRSGSFNDPRKWGRGSGIWMMNCDGFLIQYCHLEEASGIGDSCGAHIDHGNKNVIVQYCYSKNNAGGFVEVLGKNLNCSYRFNISVDDGWRNSQQRDPEQSRQYWAGTTALTLGTLVSVSGYTGGPFIGPYQTYIYNNTIINTRERKDGFHNPFVFQITTSATGVLVANNIFYTPQQLFSGWSEHIKTKDGVKFIQDKAYNFRRGYKDGDSFAVRDMNGDEVAAMDVDICNNLYLLYDPQYLAAENVLPQSLNAEGKQFGYLDAKALGGDPQFANIDGEVAECFIPANREVIERGIAITKLASDKTSYGLSPRSSDLAKGSALGLEMKQDMFGNEIKKPIIGACV